MLRPTYSARRLVLGAAAAAAIALWARSPRCQQRHSLAATTGSAMAAFAKPEGTCRIMLTGDVMLGRGVDQILPHHCDPALYEPCVRDARTYVELALAANGPLPRLRGFDYPWGFALQDMQDKAPDARVINLETSVTTAGQPWPKGINYRMHPGNVPTLTAAGVDVVCLANNHVLDWGREGLLETLDVLHGAGLQTAGAGRDLAEAESPAVVPLPARGAAGSGGERPGAAGSGGAQGGRLLVWAVGHSSSGVPDAWSAARVWRQSGVLAADLSPAGVRHLADLVQQHKRPGDIALVSVHWGSNWGFSVPAEQRRFAHALIDEGVDVIHGHSSHHLKGAELYRGRLVIYGCGDLISDYEGISNADIEAEFPAERYRDDVGALWYADLALGDGRLRQLILTPTRLKRLSLHAPEPRDLRYMQQTVDREFHKLGGWRSGVRLAGGATGGPAAPALVLEPVPDAAEE